MGLFVRSAFRIGLAALAAVCGYVVIVACSLVWSGSYDNAQSADVIVVMGAAQYDGEPSPLLESRLAHALKLWQDKRAPLIAVTGGKQEADRFTEAAASRRWLTDRGVPTSAIVAEETGRSTWESLENLQPVLAASNVRTAIAASSNWHVERVRLTLKELGFHATGSPAGSSTWSREIVTQGKTIKEVVGVAFGRLIGFERLFSISG
jgi:uncharacterized SAM-binding protein YcdF (DUF218 family)